MIWAILPFVQQHLTAILIAIAVLVAVGYVGTIKIQKAYYKHQVVQFEQQAKENDMKNQQLEKAAADITEKYKDSLKTNKALIDKNRKLATEKIQNDKELRDMRLSANAVRLFNDTKPSANGQNPTATVGTNDGSTGANKTFTVADAFAVSAENDINHQVCIDTVLKWQNFWKDYSTRLKAITQQ